MTELEIQREFAEVSRRIEENLRRSQELCGMIQGSSFGACYRESPKQLSFDFGGDK